MNRAVLARHPGIARQLDERYQSFMPRQRPLSTLLGLISLPREIIISYVGDGTAMLTTGRLVVARNLLLPHWDDHKNHTRDVSPDRAVQPSIIRIGRNFDEGAILLLGTDGALPRPRLPDSSSEEFQLLRAIKTWYVGNSGWERSDSEVRQSIRAILKAEMKNWQIDDDATVGLLITSEAAAFWRQEAYPPPPEADIRHRPQDAQ